MKHFANKREALMYALDEIQWSISDDIAESESVYDYEQAAELGDKLDDIEAARGDMVFGFFNG